MAISHFFSELSGEGQLSSKTKTWAWIPLEKTVNFRWDVTLLKLRKPWTKSNWENALLLIRGISPKSLTIRTRREKDQKELKADNKISARSLLCLPEQNQPKAVGVLFQWYKVEAWIFGNKNVNKKWRKKISLQYSEKEQKTSWIKKLLKKKLQRVVLFNAQWLMSSIWINFVFQNFGRHLVELSGKKWWID